MRIGAKKNQKWKKISMSNRKFRLKKSLRNFPRRNQTLNFISLEM